MPDDWAYKSILEDSIKLFFNNFSKVMLKNPSLAKFALQTVKRQRKAAKVRAKWEKEGVHVPPFIIFSVTNRCNLSCKGCYSRAQHRPMDKEITDEKMRAIMKEGSELGISIMLIAGGEPLIRKDMLDAMSSFPDVMFPVFTNGLLIDNEMIKKLKKRNNIVPIISIEGNDAETDDRRGKDVHARVTRTIERLGKAGIFAGCSFTMTSKNFDTLMSEDYLQGLIDIGSKIFFFVEYTPVTEGTENLILTEKQRASVPALMNKFREKFPALFIAFPGDEEQFGGCLAAGRGFVHISAEGDVEPCPFAPYSDASLNGMTLKEALSSEFLKAIREKHDELVEAGGGCALFTHRETVKAMLRTTKENKIYKTN